MLLTYTYLALLATDNCYNLAHTSGKVIDLIENFIEDVFLEKEVPVNFGSHPDMESRFGLRIPTRSAFHFLRFLGARLCFYRTAYTHYMQRGLATRKLSVRLSVRLSNA